MAELLNANNINFSRDTIIGEAAYYLIYKGELSNGLTVALKSYDPGAFPPREFRAEVETLGKLRHPNIIKLQGYCTSGSVRVLVFDFFEKGDLHSWLYPDQKNISFLRLPLSWETRLKIVRDVAEGLAYLHGLEEPIIHRDINPSNVLLDWEFRAHIANFALARRIDLTHSHVTTQVEGTLTYMAPEYRVGSTIKATVKADVYSFGVLMMETVIGQVPDQHSKLGGMNTLDPKISWERLDEANVKEYFKIASLCVTMIPKDRPDMRKVVQMLNQIPL